MVTYGVGFFLAGGTLSTAFSLFLPLPMIFSFLCENRRRDVEKRKEMVYEKRRGKRREGLRRLSGGLEGKEEEEKGKRKTQSLKPTNL